MARGLCRSPVSFLTLTVFCGECFRLPSEIESTSFANLTISREFNQGWQQGEGPFCDRLISLGDYLHERSEALFTALAIVDIASYQGTLQGVVAGSHANWAAIAGGMLSNVYSITLAVYNVLKLFYRKCANTLEACSSVLSASWAIFGIFGLAFLFLPCLGGIIAAGVGAAAVHGVVPFVLALVGPLVSRTIENICDFYQGGNFDYKRVIIFAITVVGSLISHGRHHTALHALTRNVPLQTLMNTARVALDYFSKHVDGIVSKLTWWERKDSLTNYFNLKKHQIMFAIQGRQAFRRFACIAVTSFDFFGAEQVHHGTVIDMNFRNQNWLYLPNEMGLFSDGFYSEVDPERHVVQIVDRSNCALPVGTQARVKLPTGAWRVGEVLGSPGWKIHFARHQLHSITLEEDSEYAVLCNNRCCARRCNPNIPPLPWV
eukprot:TRINITY_DN45332_c0_g1_i1.p1 TRINITY_DN45332_c0_g1~~TRINITY_DN45332_c0_g1_i1.p1  ORF type:complete len:453 (-),score=13.48 TRINITY_DN45332_c0_g1_i1:211-1506(-)